MLLFFWVDNLKTWCIIKHEANVLTLTWPKMNGVKILVASIFRRGHVGNGAWLLTKLLQVRVLLSELW